MTLQHLAEAQAERLGMPGIEPDADGAFTFAFEEGLVVSFLQEGDHSFYLRGEVGSLPTTGDTEAALRRLLQLNFVRIQQQKAFLSVNPEQNLVFLHERLEETQLSVDDAIQAMEQFLNTLEFWRKTLSSEPELPRGPLPFFIR